MRIAGPPKATFLVAILVAAAFALPSLVPAREIRVNLGPGDGGLVEGFAPDHEIVEKRGWHWTTYRAEILLPATIVSPDAELALRFRRVFPQEARVTVRANGALVGEFAARGGADREARFPIPPGPGPWRVEIATDSHEGRDRGLWMDDARLVSGAGGLRLAGTPRFSLGLATLALAVAFALVGGGRWGPACAIALTVAIAGFLWVARSDVFAAARQWAPVPTFVAAVAILLAFFARPWLSRLGVGDEAARGLCLAAACAAAFRLAAISHPDFYYPDLRTHATVVEAIRATGPSFYLRPADSLAAQGAWTKPVLGASTTLPYAVAFHSLFVPPAQALAWSVDDVERAFKAAGAALSAVPVLLAGVLAVRLGFSPWTALALAVVPTYFTRLTFALLPALLGHAMDLLFLAWLAGRIARGPVAPIAPDALSPAPPQRGWIGGAILVAAQLSYTSSVVNLAVFVSTVVALLLFDGLRGDRDALRRAFGLAGIGLGASAVSVALYYRHFVPDLAALAARFGSAAAIPRYPQEGVAALLVARSVDFFGPALALAAVGALWLGARGAGDGTAGAQRGAGALLAAWGIAYAILIALRARIPDVFRYGHETTFVTPLVALLAAVTVDRALRSGRRGTKVLVGIGTVLCLAWSLWRHATALREQFGNAL